ncbi:MAG TPA: TOBE-like domain-containing protein [Polyangiaceae bacterium]|nr:TOBE-like domain-containing protein [Polyangiaceae bacterium]
MQPEAIDFPTQSSSPAPSRAAAAAPGLRRAQRDPSWVRWLLTAIALGAVLLIVGLPIVFVFVEALAEGPAAYLENLFGDADTRQSMLLTLTVVPIALGANVLFGLAAAWSISRFQFRGRAILTSLIDLPFSVSPVVAGLMFVLIFGLQGYLGPLLRRDGYSIMPIVTSLPLSLIRLEGLGQRYPSQLSGGQRQRVALARALAARPRVLWLDEPFGALDAKVRQELRQWLQRLHEEIQVTSVFVTHDQEEAFEVADRVVVMNHGRIEQVGSPSEVFEHPANAFVMDFLGNVNVFQGRVEQGKAVVSGLELPAAEYAHLEAQPAAVYVRPHELQLERAQSTNSLAARVIHVNPTGARTKIELRALGSDQLINAELSAEPFAELGIQSGDTVHVSPRRVRVFAPEYSI